MAQPVNFNAFQQAQVTRQSLHEIGGRKIDRYSFQGNFIDYANAIRQFLQDNPHLIFLSNPQANRQLEDLLQENPFLVLNNNIVCLTGKSEAPNDLLNRCRDLFFSGTAIDEPVYCSNGRHIFERRYALEWVHGQGNRCPYGQHEMGPLEVDDALAQEIGEELKRLTKQKALQHTQRNHERKLIKLEHAIPKGATPLINWPEDKNTLTFLQLISPEKIPPHQKAIDHLSTLASEELLKIFTTLSRQISTPEKFKEVNSRLSIEHFESVLLHLKIDPEKEAKLLTKLRHLPGYGAAQKPRSITKQLSNMLLNIEMAANDFLPTHAPSNPWEAQQMMAVVGVAVSFVYQVAISSGLPGLTAIGAAGAGYAIYKNNSNNLPHDLPPCRNLTNTVSHESLPLIGRDNIIERVFQCWIATNQTTRLHPLLVGETGVGKSNIISEIARRIASQGKHLNIPDSLKEGALYECTAAELLPQSQNEGQGRFTKFIQKIETVKDRAVIAIDEVHTFMNQEYVGRFGELIKPVLDTRGPPYMLFTTTQDDYNKFIKVNDTHARRFHVIKVNPLDNITTTAVLKQQITFEYPHVLYEMEVLNYIVEASNQLAAKDTKYRQPNIAKQVLSRAIGKLKTEMSPSAKFLEEKMREKVQLLNIMTSDTDFPPEQEQAVDKLNQVNRDIADLENKVNEDKEKIESYTKLIKKFIQFMALAIRLSQFRRLEEEDKQLKFLIHILIPELIRMKRDMEKELKFQPLSQAHVDSVIPDFQR